MGPATALAMTHLPHAVEAPRVCKGPERGLRVATPREIRAAVLGRLQSGTKCAACGATGEQVHPYTHVVVDCEPCDGTGYLPPGSEGVQ